MLDAVVQASAGLAQRSKARPGPGPGPLPQLKRLLQVGSGTSGPVDLLSLHADRNRRLDMKLHVKKLALT